MCIKYLCPEIYRQMLSTRVVVQVEQPKKRTEKRAVKKYTPDIEAKLDVSRRLFAKYDANGDGCLDEKEILSLMTDTYKELNMAHHTPDQDDIDIWMDMSDMNRDGRVSLEEYDDLVVKSLEKAGFKVQATSVVMKEVVAKK